MAQIMRQIVLADTTATPKFKVTLGIMPDYLYDGKGLRIDGVTKNKTAAKSKFIIVGFMQKKILLSKYKVSPPKKVISIPLVNATIDIFFSKK